MLKSLCLLLFTLAAHGHAPPGHIFDPNVDFNTLGNNSLFLQWRQSFHFLAPAGHMNDPCGPMYDPKTDTYHLFYQSFPNHVNGGNGSWGHAVSKNLITWQDMHGWSNREAIALQPGPYPEVDWIGAWTGGAVPVSLDGRSNGNLTIFYTCVSKLPVGYTEPEPVGAEKQCVATSSDGGVTWQKYSGGPIMDQPPAGWNFTAFRDPHVRAIPELDAILGVDTPQYYMVIASGIKGVGPRIPLYSANATDLTKWKFLGALFEMPENYSSTGDTSVSGSFGFNFEVPGFFPLREEKVNGGDGHTTHFAIHAGTEGGNTNLHTSPHWTMFALGSVHRRYDGSAEMSLRATGPLDWGNFYAANSFWDPKQDRQVIWGWSDESTDMPVEAYRPQGYQGSLSLPRELFVKKASGLLPPQRGIESDPAHWVRTDNGSYTVTTLGTRPLSDVVTTIRGCGESVGSMNVTGNHRLRNITSDHFHLHAEIESFPSSGRVGFIVRESPNREEFTKITWTPSNSSVTVSRLNSSVSPNFAKTTNYGHFEPYRMASPFNKTEVIIVDIFVDGSLLEVFINDRFALTTRAYPSRADALAISLFSDGGSTFFHNVTVYTNMLDVWPDRPMNSSSSLHYDPYYETHVTIGNPYVPQGTELYVGW